MSFPVSEFHKPRSRPRLVNVNVEFPRPEFEKQRRSAIVNTNVHFPPLPDFGGSHRHHYAGHNRPVRALLEDRLQLFPVVAVAASASSVTPVIPFDIELPTSRLAAPSLVTRAPQLARKETRFRKSTSSVRGSPLSRLLARLSVRMPIDLNEEFKVKYNAVSTFLHESLKDITGNRRARVTFTETWWYTNEHRAQIVRWPAGLQVRRLGRIQGKTQTMDWFIQEVRQRRMYIRILSSAEFAAFRAANTAPDWKPKVRKTRWDSGYKRPDLRTKTYHGRVLKEPKSAEFVDSDVDEWSESGERDIDEIEDFENW